PGATANRVDCPFSGKRCNVSTLFCDFKQEWNRMTFAALKGKAWKRYSGGDAYAPAHFHHGARRRHPAQPSWLWRRRPSSAPIGRSRRDRLTAKSYSAGETPIPQEDAVQRLPKSKELASRLASSCMTSSFLPV